MSQAQRLSQLVAEVLRVPAHCISDGLTLAGTDNWDSLTHMELIAAVEDEFAVELSADDIVTMISFAGIRSVLICKGVPV